METLELWIWSMVLPAVLLIVGALMKTHPPKKPNALVGYRTERSGRSQKAWDYANRRYASLLLPYAAAAAVLCVDFNLLLPLDEGVLIFIDLIPPFAALIVPIVRVERELEERFDEQGTPRGEAGKD